MAAGNGVCGIVDGAATAASLCWPSHVAVTASGDVYVADTSNSKLRLLSNGTLTVSPQSTLPFAFESEGLSCSLCGANPSVATWAVQTVAGTGKTGNVDSISALSADLFSPVAVAVHPTGRGILIGQQ